MITRAGLEEIDEAFRDVSDDDLDALIERARRRAVEAAALIERLYRRSVVITPTVQFARSRDPDDDKFLECALTGSADYLVSADADLLSLREVQDIPIVDAPTFWQKLIEQQVQPSRSPAGDHQRGRSQRAACPTPKTHGTSTVSAQKHRRHR